MRRPNGYLYRSSGTAHRPSRMGARDHRGLVGGHPGSARRAPRRTPSLPHGGWSTSTACTTGTRRTARSISAGAPGRRRAAKSSWQYLPHELVGQYCEGGGVVRPPPTPAAVLLRGVVGIAFTAVCLAVRVDHVLSSPRVHVVGAHHRHEGPCRLWGSCQWRGLQNVNKHAAKRDHRARCLPG